MAQKQIPLRQVVKILNSQGHNIEYRNRTDGSIIVTSIDGRKTKIVEGNKIIRTMAGVPLSEKRKAQTSRNVTEKIIKPIKISTRTRDMLAQAKKELEKSNVKMKLTTDRLREHIKLYGEANLTDALGYNPPKAVLDQKKYFALSIKESQYEAIFEVLNTWHKALLKGENRGNRFLSTLIKIQAILR